MSPYVDGSTTVPSRCDTAASFHRADTFRRMASACRSRCVTGLLVAGEAYLPRRRHRGGERVHALAARHGMFLQAGSRPLAVARGDQGEDLLVLEGRLAQPPRLGERVTAEQAELVDEPAVHLQQF